MQDTAMHWLSVDEIMHNQKIRQLTSSKDRILTALKGSKYLQLSPEFDKVRRPDFVLPKMKPNRDLRRTVFLYGIPCNKSESELRAMLSQYGNIKRIHSEALESIDVEAPNREVSQLIMRKKYLFPPRYDRQSDHGSDTESIASISSVGSRFSDITNSKNHAVLNPNGNAEDFSHLTTCFVVFESQSQATKCVKHRVRAADGMRAIHKYDYNKVAKKYRIAAMKGETLRFSPPPTPQQQQQQQNHHHHNVYRINRSVSPVPSKYRQQMHNRQNSSDSRAYQSYRSQPNMSSHPPQPVNNRFSGWNGRQNRSNYHQNQSNNKGHNRSFYNGSSNRENNSSHQQPRRNRLGSRKDRSSYDNNQEVNDEHANNYQSNRRTAQAANYHKNQSSQKQWKRSSSSNKSSPMTSPHRSVGNISTCSEPTTSNKENVKNAQLPQVPTMNKSKSEIQRPIANEQKLKELNLSQATAPIVRSQSVNQQQQQHYQPSKAPKLYNPIPAQSKNGLFDIVFLTSTLKFFTEPNVTQRLLNRFTVSSRD